MPESLDKRFDGDITRSMKFETRLTRSQQQSARERLLSCAAQQTILPPLEATQVERATLRDHAHLLGQQTLRLLHLLLIDSSIYERARKPPRLYQYYRFPLCENSRFNQEMQMHVRFCI